MKITFEGDTVFVHGETDSLRATRWNKVLVINIGKYSHIFFPHSEIEERVLKRVKKVVSFNREAEVKDRTFIGQKILNLNI